MCSLATSIYQLRKRRLTPTWNLMRLAREARIPERFRPTVVFLASSHTLSRYPDVSSAVPFERYTKQDAAKRIKMTEEGNLGDTHRSPR